MEPKDVMKEAGLEVLSANLIKSWWSTYHQKNRNLLDNAPSATTTSSVTLKCNSTPSSAPPASVIQCCTYLCALHCIVCCCASQCTTCLCHPVHFMLLCHTMLHLPLCLLVRCLLLCHPVHNLPVSSSFTMLQAFVSGSISSLSSVVSKWSFAEYFSLAYVVEMRVILALSCLCTLLCWLLEFLL